MTDEFERDVAAKLAAHKFVISFLLRAFLGSLDPQTRQLVVDTALHGLGRTEQFSRATIGDDFAAVQLSDQLEKIQGFARELIEEALDACRRAERDMT